MRTIRGGKGLGDALYVQAVARHIVAGGERIAVATAWPDVYAPLGDRVECVPFRKSDIQILAHYALRKHQRTDQFTDVCLQAGLPGAVDLRLDWTIRDAVLVESLRREAAGRQICLVQLPRVPMDRKDGFGAELLPDGRALQRAVDTLRGRVLLVQVGAGRALYKLSGLDVDLAGQTTVAQLLDVATAADGALGYVSYILPLCESLGKPSMLIWSRRGLKSPVGFVRQITPAKTIHRTDLARWVRDGEADDVEGTANAFLR